MMDNEAMESPSEEKSERKGKLKSKMKAMIRMLRKMKPNASDEEIKSIAVEKLKKEATEDC